jgi:hypothetical protein
MDAAQHNGKRKKRENRVDERGASRKPKRAHLRAREPTTCPTCGRYFNSGGGLRNHLRSCSTLEAPGGAKSSDDGRTVEATADDEGDSEGSSSTNDAGTVVSTADDDDGPESEVDLYLSGLAHLDPAYLQRHSRLEGHLTKQEREIIRFLMVGISTLFHAASPAYHTLCMPIPAV